MALDIEKFETKSSKEKQEVIDTILGLATHNAFSKTDLLYMLRWQRARTERLKCCSNCKYVCGNKFDSGLVCDEWSMYEEND